MLCIKRYSLLSLIGLFLFLGGGLQGQASFQLHSSVEMPMGQLMFRTQKSLGFDYQNSLGDRFIVGTGLHAKTWFLNLPFFEEGDNSSTEIFIIGSPKRGVVDPFFGFPIFLPGSTSSMNSTIRFDIPVYVGLRLSRHSYIPWLLKFGLGNNFTQKFRLNNSVFVPDGVRYALDGELGLQIPLYRSMDWGLSVEPYYQYGQSLDFPVELLPLDIFRASVHSFGLRMQVNFFK